MSASTPRVLIVDDDDTFRGVLARELGAAGMRVDTLASGEQAAPALRDHPYDVVLLDLRMPGLDGVNVLERIKAVRPLTEVIILTGHGTLENAVQTLKRGAFDFLTKPCDLDHLESVVRNAASASAMRSENAALRRALRRGDEPAALVGRSRAMRAVRELIEKVAPSSSTVLIRGESGAGKEVVARAVHGRSGRHHRPFVHLDCGATEENLVLSELFGHERGAYTGATGRKQGLFELADAGVLLVDEVGDAPPSLQTRLLRVLETGTFRRLGGEESIRVDVRVLAATHRNLEELVRAGGFRQDLYYRLDVMTIDVPPLRERLEDVPQLVEHFLRLLCPTPVPEVEPAVLDRLQQYAWPGNVRELRNVIERAVILAEGDSISLADLPANLSGGRPPWQPPPRDATPSLREVEHRYLTSLLERFDGHRGRVAAALGISERTLYRKLQQWRRRGEGGEEEPRAERPGGADPS